MNARGKCMPEKFSLLMNWWWLWHLSVPDQSSVFTVKFPLVMKVCRILAIRRHQRRWVHLPKVWPISFPWPRQVHSSFSWRAGPSRTKQHSTFSWTVLADHIVLCYVCTVILAQSSGLRVQRLSCTSEKTPQRTLQSYTTLVASVNWFGEFWKYSESKPLKSLADIFSLFRITSERSSLTCGRKWDGKYRLWLRAS